MNYFIDIPSFSRFYTVNDEDDEKPPPDLKTTGNPIEERIIKKGIRRKQTDETSLTLPADETMGSRKEKSSWPDWQFWKRSDSSGGPFGAFRKSTKSTGQSQSGSFTFRKDINDSVKVNKSDVTSEHAPSNFGKNVGQKTVVGKSRNSEESGSIVRASEAEDPLVSYKECNGSKHVVINMNKVETMAGRKDVCQTATGEVSLNIMEEKYSKSGQAGHIANQKDQRGTKAAQSSPGQNSSVGVENYKHGHNINRKVDSEQHSGMQKQSPINPSRATVANIDEKSHGNGRRDASGSSAAKKNGENGSCKTIKNSVIPVPRINPKQVAEKKQSESKPNETTTTKGACLEQGKLHNVLKKVPDTSKPVNGNSTPAQNLIEPVPVECEVPGESVGLSESNSPGTVKVANDQPEVQPLINPKPEYNVTRRHTSQKASRRHNVLHHGKVRVNISQKPTVVGSGRLQKIVKNTNEKKVEKSKEETSDKVIDKATTSRNNVGQLREKAPVIMKDVSTATPSPRATVDVEVQVPCEECMDNKDVSGSASGFVDETMSLLKKRPWDTERVLKMQVLLDEKQVVIGQLKSAGRKQREELRASRRRCADFENIINQANMEDKPQLLIQINELTDIKNELVDEISRLTVDIERERTNVKTLKNELIELKGQLNCARKRNANFAGQ